MAMGQEIGVTPLQIVAAASLVANDGVWLRPRILLDDAANGAAIEADAKSKERPSAFDTAARDAGDRESADEDARRVISAATAGKMQMMMAETVLAGTGKAALPKGYSAGGKTGTAQKLDPATGTYSRTDNIASFVGFTPVEAPMFTILVVLDSPRGRNHGGDVAAPVFGRIAEQILAYRNLPGTAAPPAERPRGNERALARITIARTKSEADQFNGEALHSVEFALPEPATPGVPGTITPNFLGASVRSVTAQALAQDLRVQLVGSGIAYEQIPPPGTVIREGAPVIVKFRIGSTPQPAPAAPDARDIPSSPAASLTEPLTAPLVTEPRPRGSGNV
jgi:membrane peptidoglycan carboxypeptidase